VRPLVVAAHELRWLGRGWLAAGVVTLGAVVVSGSLGELTALEVAAVALVFGLSLGGAIGGLVLGVRTGPPILYRRIFDIAPPPPPDARGESRRTTARRAVWTALAAGVFLALGAALALPATLILLGTPRHELLDHLPQAAGLVASGWLLVAGAVALEVATWFERWQRLHERVIVCAPLHSGLLRHVYYAAERAE
jgi:hypothetical protein